MAPSNDRDLSDLSGDLLVDAYVEPDWDRFLHAVSGAAFPERWSPPGDPATSMKVLSAVVRYTYRRAVAQRRVAIGTGERGQAALVFACGLFTPGLELLYCVGSPTDARQDWAIKGVETQVRAARHLGSPPPPPATFWDDPAQLVLDPAADFYVDVEDLASRESFREALPESLRGLPAPAVLPLLDGAIARARRLANLNPRVVAPAFNFRGKTGEGELTLLLPLNLASGTEPDMALVLKEIETGDEDRLAYRAASVIDMGRAYTSARVVAPLDSVWQRSVLSEDS